MSDLEIIGAVMRENATATNDHSRGSVPQINLKNHPQITEFPLFWNF